MPLRVAIQTEEETLLGFFHKPFPRSVRALSDVNRKGLDLRVEMVKGQRGFVAVVTTLHAATALLLNQQMSSLSSTQLLRDVILMFVVRECVLAAEGTEFGLPAAQFRFANETDCFHMTSEVGLQAYHTQILKKWGSFQVRL